MIPEFETWFGANLPAWLRVDAPPPASWTGDREGWDALRDAARRSLRDRATIDFVDRLASGWRLDELARGALDVGAEVGVLDGSVRRAERSVEPILQGRARRLQAELAAAPGAPDRVPPVIMSNLDAIARGTWGGDERSAERTFAEVASVINAVRGEHANAVHAAASAAQIRVAVAFDWTGGRHFEPGIYSVTPDLLRELRQWRTTSEAYARSRGHEAPEGTWPPFEELRIPSAAPA